MDIQNKFISSGCNTVYKAVSWHKQLPLIAYSSSNQVNIYDYKSYRVPLSLIGHGGRVNVPKFLIKQKEITLISGASDGSLIIWKNSGNYFSHLDWRQDFSTKLDESIANITICEISETLAYIITVTTSTQVTLWQYDSKELKPIETLHFGTTYQEAVEVELLDGKYLFILLGGIDKLVHIYTYEIENKEAKLQYHLSLKGHENAITDFAITKAQHADENYYLIASGSRDVTIRLWKLADYDKEKDQMKAFQNKNNHKIVLPNGKLMILSLESILNGHSDQISSVTWGLIDNQKSINETNLCLMSTGFDFSCYIWTNDKKDDLWVNRVRLGQIGGNRNAFFGASYNGDYTKIIAYTYTGAFYLWKIENENQYNLLPTITGHFGAVTDLDWSSEGDYFVSCSSDQTTRVYGEWIQNSTWHELSRAQIHGYDMNAVKNIRVPQQEGKKFADYIVSGGDEKVIRMFEPAPTFINTINALGDKNLRLYFEKAEEEEKYLDKSDPKKQRYAVNTEGTTKVLGLMNIAVPLDKPDIKYGKEDDEEGGVAEDEGVQETISYDYKTAPVEDYLVKHTLWPEFNKLYGHGYELKAIATNSKGTLIASSCKSQSQDHAIIILWNPKTFTIIDRITFHSYTAIQLDFSDNDEYLVSASRDRQIGLFKHDPEDKQHPYKLVWSDKSHSRIVWTVAFSHDTNYFVSGARDKTIKVWKMGEKPTMVVSQAFDTPVAAVCFGSQEIAPGKYLIAVGIESGNILLLEFNTESNKLTVLHEVHKYLRHSLSVNRIKFKRNTPKGQMTFATCSDDHSVKVFDIILK